MVVKENMANRKNILLIALGTLMLIVGFIFLGTGPVDGSTSMTLAPVVLVVAYLIVIPLGILWNRDAKDK